MTGGETSMVIAAFVIILAFFWMLQEARHK